jgi:hypothetical protein
VTRTTCTVTYWRRGLRRASSRFSPHSAGSRWREPEFAPCTCTMLLQMSAISSPTRAREEQSSWRTGGGALSPLELADHGAGGLLSDFVHERLPPQASCPVSRAFLVRHPSTRIHKAKQNQSMNFWENKKMHLLVQGKKVYVQDRLRESGDMVWSLLERGAHFYVCGDAAGMAPAVEHALLDIIQWHQVRRTAPAKLRFRRLFLPTARAAAHALGTSCVWRELLPGDSWSQCSAFRGKLLCFTRKRCFREAQAALNLVRRTDTWSLFGSHA